MAQRTSPKAVLAAWAVAFNQHDIETLRNLYAEKAVNHQVADEPVRGREEITAGFSFLFNAFPDIGFEVINIHEDGEWAIIEWHGWSTHRNRLDDPAFSGRDGERMHGCGFFRIQEGKIVFQRGYWDKETWMRTSGAPSD